MAPRQHQFTRDSLGLAFTQYLVRAMSMARGFVAAKMLEPLAVGAWNEIALLCVMFVNVANVGTSILRSHGDIGGLTRLFVLQGLIGSGLGLTLMVWMGRWDLLWGWFAGCLVALLF